ncbi:MAG: hypothetical protein KAU03_02590 [Candidatus Altiarchaeales archaeon]|nr:hypothetical protein [Candidatus Altiarchaeales archaeon]
MKIIPTTIGGYPRPDWFKGYLKEVEGSQRGDIKEIEESRYRRALGEVLEEQKKSGIVLFTDGQLLWQDFLCHLCTKIGGFEMGGLIRYFDNNVYYRMPKATAKLSGEMDIVVGEFRTAHEIESEIKAVLSCFTLAGLSKDEFYRDKKEFILDIAEVMNHEARKLVDAGARHIQIDEPSLLYADKEDLETAREAVDVIRRGVEAEFFLTTYFGDAEKIFPEILDFDVDVLGLDFVEGGDKNIELLREYKTKKDIQAGIVDGRTTKIEKPGDVKDRVNAVVEVIDGETLYVSPNTGLEFLPYQKASEKLRMMCDSVDLI